MKLSKKVFSTVLALLMILPVLGISFTASAEDVQPRLVSIEIIDAPTKSIYDISNYYKFHSPAFGNPDAYDLYDVHEIMKIYYDYSGLKLLATYSDGSTKTVTGEESQVYIYYKDKTDKNGNPPGVGMLEEKGIFNLFVSYSESYKEVSGSTTTITKTADNIGLGAGADADVAPFQMIVYNKYDVYLYNYEMNYKESVNVENLLSVDRDAYAQNYEYTQYSAWKTKENNSVVKLEDLTLTGIGRGDAKLWFTMEDVVMLNGEDQVITYTTTSSIRVKLTFWQWLVQFFFLFGWLGFNIYL